MTVKSIVIRRMSPCLLVLLIMLSTIEIMTRVTTSPRDATPTVNMGIKSEPGGIPDTLRLTAKSISAVSWVATNVVRMTKNTIMIMNWGDLSLGTHVGHR